MFHVAGGTSYSSSGGGRGSGSHLDRDTEMIMQMCEIYISLSGQISDLTGHVSALSRIFGPSLSTTYANSSRTSPHRVARTRVHRWLTRRVRARLCEVYQVLTEHPSLGGQLDNTASTLESSVAVEGDESGIEEPPTLEAYWLHGTSTSLCPCCCLLVKRKKRVVLVPRFV